MPPYSVIIPWRDRPELATTLKRNRDIFARHDAEIIVVNAGGDFAALNRLTSEAGVPDVRHVDVPGASFTRSLCGNIGTLVSRGEVLFLLDADIMLESDVFAESRALLEDGTRFVTIRRIVESQPVMNDNPNEPDMSFLAEMRLTKELFTVDGRRAVLSSLTSPRGLRAGDGQVLVRRRDMVAIGGFNSNLTGWGYEDTDVQVRLQFVLGLERAETGEVIHLSHGVPERDPAAWRWNMAVCARNYSDRRYQGTLEEDARRWQATLVETTGPARITASLEAST
jgi:predicted glycosyltransferase involved in capsule biosynthesis